MPIYYEAKALERAIDTAPRITPSTKSVLKKIIRSAPGADEVEKLREERDAAVADIRGVMRNAADTCYRCEHRFGIHAAECCIDCEDGSNWEWRGVVDETD